ncbi:hypothetical protein Lfu02_06070 [Longispora fulva]|uniref:Ig-like domain-containing protein n=1 Tax=Longispora fulva TaxID=619741 RepID=A0A8J7KEY6_9ACTN|nr:hypothetical protein [Longispora fulva]MBG6135525.1 hypothetical protein [Longispora fulva]GIG56235.1 hypothetical protein Lfu02_06070 [Longispora fulva]
MSGALWNIARAATVLALAAGGLALAGQADAAVLPTRVVCTSSLKTYDCEFENNRWAPLSVTWAVNGATSVHPDGDYVWGDCVEGVRVGATVTVVDVNHATHSLSGSVTCR